ncbi:helix-turn-helix domain-containing protein [Enterococcus faecalis]|uniref:Helix-turn-helix domain-containing protein n=2 Tax=Enterococcus gallinarum TaxID=1353 RepID=A0AAE7T0Y9_ENTGA|nr:helix-turn-helix domain-containing protein [Enterococcus faecalis]MBM6741820.1 helix-turn-helix domain-containing protein [Enterococcus gallinarum]QOG28489.1 helix-turn-helix domain-containing protein [Enterococcus gallinarum]ROY69749.1 helix-turn-helix domain-containing protein [Enterococcus gallinarum]ROZ31997.1 helix-turn-helix domain-containing protein [Enterococcus gallinarum]
MDLLIENFGHNLARLRKKRGITQKELANTLSINVQSISNIEKGKSYPTFNNLEKIASFFDASPIELFGTEKEIMTSDVPTILEKIDESDEILRTVFKAEKILDENYEPIQELANNLDFIDETMRGQIIYDDYNKPLINDDGSFVREKPLLDTVPIDLIKETADNISFIHEEMQGTIIYDNHNKPLVNKDGSFVRKNPLLETVPIDLINQTAENLRFILDNKDKI